MNELSLGQAFWLGVLMATTFSIGVLMGFALVSLKMQTERFWPMFLRSSSLRTKGLMLDAILDDPEVSDYFCKRDRLPGRKPRDG